MDIESWLPILYRTWKHACGTSQSASHAKGRDYPNQAELQRLAKGVSRLSRGFTGYRNLVGSRYLDDPELLGAYLLYYWPISYLQTQSIALDLHSRNHPLPLRIMDCGSGPGPVAYALLDAARLTGAQGPAQLSFLDHSNLALQIAESLAEAYAVEVRPKTTIHVWNPEKPYGPTNQNATRTPGILWDAICFGHSLNELWKQRTDSTKQRQGLIQDCMSQIQARGFLLAVEPALRESTTQLLGLRDTLLTAGYPLIGPCNFAGPCPALAAGQTCHGQISQVLPKTVQALAQLAGLDKHHVAMSWLALSPQNAPTPAKSDWWRVCSEAMVNKAGRTRYTICGPEGRCSFSAKLDTPPNGNQKQFASLVRGQAIRVHTPEVREGGLGLGSATQVEILDFQPEKKSLDKGR
jgi:hypothetical protein